MIRGKNMRLNLDLKSLKKSTSYEELLQKLYEQGYRECNMAYNIQEVANHLIKTVVI